MQTLILYAVIGVFAAWLLWAVASISFHAGKLGALRRQPDLIPGEWHRGGWQP